MLRLLSLLAAAVAVAGAVYLWTQSGHDAHSGGSAPYADNAPPDNAPPDAVSLHPDERAAAGIELASLHTERLHTTLTLPGRIAYDETQHVAIAAAAAGALQSVLVQPGDSVLPGQTLAVMRCPKAGLARTELMQLQTDAQLAARELDWREATAAGVQKLIYLVQSGEGAEQIETSLRSDRLGDHRAKLLAALNEKQLAEQLADSSRGGGVLSGRELARRQSAARVAGASFLAEIEQAGFEATQDLDRARAAAEAAARRAQIAKQELATLLGLAGNADQELVPADEAELSVVKVVSPIAGVVERRNFSRSERVATGDELFIVANTDRLWVEADIRGGDWRRLHLEPGATVLVSTPATGGDRWEARVRYLGRQIDPDAGSAPLVAEFENTQPALRPGMFARVQVPTSEAAETLVAPDSAVVDVDGVPAVFVPDGDAFRLTPVKLGRRFDGRVELCSPLRAGDQVVSQGAFFLKSELLLAGEE
ncbi:Nickel and cobalt resistance protein CnrB [Posidoniimonas polymericola]|uniref:Nickel and cobalt resistance protein CnrB n=1 Tax=Posidoniimonas polymericola TaxID=2528002 RepID=A0A5C5YKU1_9BACT|nr:efflux RND transporter periplasmic adaptor subunit [Posidoniimonas polymericola]TWT75533.1 Nickel and cobalt resistance protein CnrB [Posidoniimonas polymericola]